MPNIGGVFRGVAQIEASTASNIYNVNCTLANTEYSQALSSNTKQFMIRVRGIAKLQVAFTSGESGTNYVTIYQGANLCSTGLNFSGTLYFQTNKAAQVVEILEWT